MGGGCYTPDELSEKWSRSVNGRVVHIIILV